MRLTCKTFSTLQTPSAALFYDFNIFTTRQSLRRLELLSQHPVLRKHLRRLVFCRPMLEAWLAEGSEYIETIRHDRWFKHEPPYTHGQEKTGLRAYKVALREQQRLIGDGTYAETCGRCITRFPRLSSIFISDGVPQALNLDSKSDAKVPTLLNKQYPNLLLRDCSQIDVLESADHHVTNVFRALAVANFQAEELVTHNEWGPSYEFSMNSVPEWSRRLNFSRLSRLDLCLRDGKQLSGGADWSSAICPMMERVPTLTELYLRFCARKNTYPTVTELWGLNAPQLTILAIEGLKLTRTAFCNFIRRHNHLRQLTLYDVRVTDSQWFQIFKTLREHPELEDLDITCVDDGRLNCPVSTFRQPELSDDTTLELHDYLHGEGAWTDRLSRHWV